jgi:hypothetical protein
MCRRHDGRITFKCLNGLNFPIGFRDSIHQVEHLIQVIESNTETKKSEAAI